MIDVRIEITGLKVGEMNELGDHIKGDWHIERKNNKVWMVLGNGVIRPEDVRGII